MTNECFSSISIDTWYEIAELLDVRDIRNLRCVNRSLYQTFSSNRIWKPLSQSRWFAIDDQPLVLLKNVEDFHSYYKQRAIIDSQIQNAVVDIAASDDPKEILELGWDITKMNFKAVPVLNELRSNSENFLVKYYATEFQRSIRRSEFFRVLSEMKRGGIVSANSPEELFFQFSYADPSFDDLLPFRRKVTEEVIDRVQAHLSSQENVSASYTVTYIRKALLQVINKPAVIQEYYGRSTYTEDVSILRIYAGETNGTTTALNSIVQRIASFFDVKCTLTRMFLVVEDISFRTGHSYVLGRKDEVMIVSYDHLQRMVGNTADSLDILLKELTIEDLVYEGLSQRYPPYCLPEHFSTKFRFSKIPFPSTRLQCLVLSYLKGITPEAGIELNCTTTFERFCGNDDSFSLPFISVMRWFPFDLLHVLDHHHFKFCTVKQTKERLIENHFVFQDIHRQSRFGEANNDQPEPQFRIGDVVLHQRSGEFGVIKGINNSDDEDFMVYDLLTNMNLSRSCQESTIQKLTNLEKDTLETLSRVFWIGYYFIGFDEKNCRFIPRKQFAANFLSPQ